MTRVAAAATVLFVIVGCGRSHDDGDATRDRWVHEQVAAHSWFVREALNGTPDIDYFDGWYPPENDPESGGGWRWIDRRSITRLRTKVAGAPHASDMTITIYGWMPWKDLGLRTSRLELSVNGHVLETFEPPRESFVHTVFVPKFLLEQSDWVDFVIAAANTAKPRGDWRDLGFCTTGFIWKPAT